MAKFFSRALPLLALQSALLVSLALPSRQCDVWAANQNYSQDQESGTSAGNSNAQDNQDVGGQSLSDGNGDMFMEEVVTDKPKPKAKPITIDLSRVGVSVDPNGNIVPLRNDPNDPWAASGVKPFYNHVETSTTMPYVYPNPYAYQNPYAYRNPFAYANPFGYQNPFANRNPFVYQNPYAYQNPFAYRNPFAYSNPFAYPNPFAYQNPYGALPFNRYPGNGYPGLFYPSKGGNGGYGGYGAYGGLGGYGGPSPFSVGYATTGNSATFISNDPITGAPIPQSGSSQTNFSGSAGSFGVGPWLAPTTSYSQNSMWKAFNLGF